MAPFATDVEIHRQLYLQKYHLENYILADNSRKDNTDYSTQDEETIFSFHPNIPRGACSAF